LASSLRFSGLGLTDGLALGIVLPGVDLERVFYCTLVLGLFFWSIFVVTLIVANELGDGVPGMPGKHLRNSLK